jgi:hypothetical protein
MQLLGIIRKMKATPSTPVQYALPIGDQFVEMNSLIGESLSLEWSGKIQCINCNRSINKSFNQGYCYPCFKSLAECDMCVVKPELCHYDQGTCRQPEWGEKNCLIPHTVYLANSSALKVGITRGEQPSARWMDQGAAQGLAIRTVPNRLSAGRLEVALSEYVGDKTNWRKMLKGAPEPLELDVERDRLLGALRAGHPDFDVPGEPVADTSPTAIEYPVTTFPDKVVAHNMDKTPRLAGHLTGIKGQYLFFGTTVINVRKYAGYEFTISDELDA